MEGGLLNSEKPQHCLYCGAVVGREETWRGGGGAPRPSLRQRGPLSHLRPLVAHCHLGLGKLSRRMGKREQEQEHLTTATTMYREMGMTYWLEQAEAELAALTS